MKKILILITTILLLAACSNKNSYSYVSDGNDVIFTGNNKSYTKADLYKSLKLSAEDTLETDIINKISQSYDIDLKQIEFNKRKVKQEDAEKRQKEREERRKRRIEERERKIILEITHDPNGRSFEKICCVTKVM